jgi:hypothetical protein
MLVLAMEFSRGVRRPQGAVRTSMRPVRWRLSDGRAAGRTPRVGRHRFGGTETAPGCSDEQEPGVTPSKRNSDAPCHPQGPQPHGRDLRRGAVRQGRDTGDSE